MRSYSWRAVRGLTLTVFLVLQSAGLAFGTDCVQQNCYPNWLKYLGVISIYFFVVAGVIALMRLREGWKLQEALSEEADPAVQPEAPVPPPGGAAAQPTHAPLVASSSRLIAFLGSLALLGMFLAFGTVAFWEFATTGSLPSEMSDVGTYFLTGAGLFIPYGANQLKSVLGGR